MGLYAPPMGGFTWELSNVALYTQPTAAYGTSVTPGTNPNMGSWTQLFTGASVVNDVYGILININSASTSATTRNLLVDIGIDNAGGTAYTVVIPYLLGGHAAPYNVGSGGFWYYFPLFIKAGSSIAARAQGTTTTAFRVYARLFGNPARPDAVECGTQVFSFGQNTTNAVGTAIALGTTSPGGSTTLGSALTTPLWWWQVGFTYIDTTMTLSTVHISLTGGTLSWSNILVRDAAFVVTAAEQISAIPTMFGVNRMLDAGETLYVYGQSSTTSDTTPTAMAWGLG